MKSMTVMLAVVFLSGCAALGLSTPKSFDQKLAQAYGIHTAIIQATTTALNAGSVSADEALQVKTQADSARTLLDDARAAETAGNETGASSDLTLALSALTALQNYLNAKGK